MSNSKPYREDELSSIEQVKELWNYVTLDMPEPKKTYILQGKGGMDAVYDYSELTAWVGGLKNLLYDLRLSVIEDSSIIGLDRLLGSKILDFLKGQMLPQDYEKLVMGHKHGL